MSEPKPKGIDSKRFSRREFLKLSSALTFGWALAACTPTPAQTPGVTETPIPPITTPLPLTDTPIPPTGTPISLNETPAPQPTPATLSGETIQGETLDMGGAQLKLSTMSGTDIAKAIQGIGPDYKTLKVLVNDKGFSDCFIGFAGDNQTQVALLAQGPKGFTWDSKQGIWTSSAGDKVFIPDVVLPGSFDEVKNTAGPSALADHVFLAQDVSGNLRAGVIYPPDVIAKLQEKGVNFKLLADGSGRGLFMGDQKIITLLKDQSIGRDTNGDLIRKNADGSYQRMITSWENVKGKEQLYQVGAFAGPFASQPDISYPNDAFVAQVGITEYGVLGDGPKTKVAYQVVKDEKTGQEKKMVVAQVIEKKTTSETTYEWQPTIPLENLAVPDPKVSNPELFDLSKPDSPIVQFASAFGIKPEEVGNLTPQLLTGVDKKQFVVMTTGDLAATANFDETGTPLLIAEQGENGEWGWTEATLAKLGEKKGMFMGAFFGGSNLGSGDFERISNIIKKEFSLGGIWIGMTDIQPNEGNFNLVNLGLSQRGLVPLYHPLIWFDSSPDWIKNKTGGELTQAIVSYVETVSKKVESNYQNQNLTENKPILIVVNEANHPRDFYYQKLGFDYIRTAFQIARENAPSAQLIYNDYDNHLTTGDRYNNTKDIVDKLRAEGLIDGVGIELVIDGNSPPIKENLIEAFKSYGLPVYITEFSVNMRNVSGSPEEKFSKQAEIYKVAMEACIESEVCPVFVDFQLGDKFSVWENNQYLPQYSKEANPTPYDDNLNPKPALYAQRKAFIR